VRITGRSSLATTDGLARCGTGCADATFAALSGSVPLLVLLLLELLALALAPIALLSRAPLHVNTARPLV